MNTKYNLDHEHQPIEDPDRLMFLFYILFHLGYPLINYKKRKHLMKGI